MLVGLVAGIGFGVRLLLVLGLYLRCRFLLVGCGCREFGLGLLFVGWPLLLGCFL